MSIAQRDAARAKEDEYGADKLALEDELHASGPSAGLWYIALRLPDVLGEHENTGRQEKLFKRLVRGAKVGTRIDGGAADAPISVVFAADVGAGDCAAARGSQGVLHRRRRRSSSLQRRGADVSASSLSWRPCCARMGSTCRPSRSTTPRRTRSSPSTGRASGEMAARLAPSASAPRTPRPARRGGRGLGPRCATRTMGRCATRRGVRIGEDSRGQTSSRQNVDPLTNKLAPAVATSQALPAARAARNRAAMRAPSRPHPKSRILSRTRTRRAASSTSGAGGRPALELRAERSGRSSMEPCGVRRAHTGFASWESRQDRPSFALIVVLMPRIHQLCEAVHLAGSPSSAAADPADPCFAAAAGAKE